MKVNSDIPINGSMPGDSFRDRIATMDDNGKRKWVYAKKPAGRFYNLRSYISWVFFLIFFGLPFVRVNGRPLFLFNVVEAKFIIFGKVFWPQDFFIFGITMVTFIVFIVLFTAAFGRLFCGWVCPQTVFMEMFFRKIEYLVEGDAASQQLLAKQPWTTEKIIKKTTKHALFYMMSFVIANFFLSYIIGTDALLEIISGPLSENVGGLFSIALFSAVFTVFTLFFREQVCTVICPYGRLQGVLLDKNSMVVAYDYRRGEPRKKIAKGDRNAGDCIDCMQCVKVCPTGIDIRNGTQMECVGCTACIDACDHIMSKINKPLGLIRYASENGIVNKEKLRFTGRMKLYTGVLILLFAILAFLLASRKDVDATIMRAPGMLFQEIGRDSISNLYNIKIANKTLQNVPLELKMEGSAGVVKMIGERNYVNVKSEDQGAGAFFVTLPRNVIRERKTELKIGLYQNGKRIDIIGTSFLGPIDDVE